MFNIGDTVWLARPDGTQKRIVCPDCFGTLQLRVTLGDGTELSIPCEGCTVACNPPCGTVATYEYLPSADVLTITGIRLEARGIEYLSDRRIVHGEDVFATRDEALARAAELVLERQAEEAKRLERKEYVTRKWSWHAHYYRKQIRDAKATIERAERLLGIAQAKAKEPAEALAAKKGATA